MHEAKAFACQVLAGRLRGPRAEPDECQRRPGRRREPVPDTPAAAQPEGRVRTWRLRNWRWRRLPQAERPAAAAGCRRSLERLIGPFRRGKAPEPPAGDGLLHRHDGLHRLQGVRGRVQAVEPAPRRRVRVDRQQLRQHRRAVGHVLAAREVRRAVRRRPAAAVERHTRLSLDVLPPEPPPRQPLADDARRVQALRRGPVPAGVPDRRDHLQRVRQRLHPAGHLQRLRVLHRRLPVRRHHPQHHLDGHAHKCTLCYDRQKDGLVPACAKACPTAVDPVRPDRRAARARPQARGGAAPARACPARTCTATRRRRPTPS